MRQQIAYARASTNEQDLYLQISEPIAAGCETIFRDKISGAKKTLSRA